MQRRGCVLDSRLASRAFGSYRPFVRSGLDAASQISAYDKIDTDRLRPAAVHNLGYWFFHRIQ